MSKSEPQSQRIAKLQVQLEDAEAALQHIIRCNNELQTTFDLESRWHSLLSTHLGNAAKRYFEKKEEGQYD